MAADWDSASYEADAATAAEAARDQGDMPSIQNDDGNYGWDDPDGQDAYPDDPDAANYADLDTQPDEPEPEAADNERTRPPEQDADLQQKVADLEAKNDTLKGRRNARLPPQASDRRLSLDPSDAPSGS